VVPPFERHRFRPGKTPATRSTVVIVLEGRQMAADYDYEHEQEHEGPA
jgi:hypothetical protein